MTWVRKAPGGAGAEIVTSHSLTAEAQRAHLALYRSIMFGESPLTRAAREAIAITVSAANDCHC